MEIKVRRKKKPVWPWLVVLIVLLAIIWILFTQFGDEIEQQLDNNTEDSYVLPDNEENSQVINEEETAYYEEVKDFINFIENTNEIAVNHQEITAKASFFLTHALSGMVDREYLDDTVIGEMRQELLIAAEEIFADSSGIFRADRILKTLNHAAELMTAMQKKDYPELKPQIHNIRKVAKSIQANPVQFDQDLYVWEFFKLSKDALEAIAKVDTI